MKNINFVFLLIIGSFLVPSFLVPSFVYAKDGDVNASEIISKWPLESVVISVSYSLDKKGIGSLSFLDSTSNNKIKVKYLSAIDEDVIKDLRLTGMQSFNGLFIVTLETATSFLVEVFVYDKSSEIVKQVVSDGGHLQPELIYYKDSDHPAIGIPKLTNDSRLASRIICGEKIYVFDKLKNTVDVKREVQLPYGKVTEKNASIFSCED